MENQTNWVLDPTHSEITFKVKHLMITNIKGEFRTFSASISSSNADFTSAKASANIDVNTIFTNNNDRDGHLKSADFFDVENNPTISFTSTCFSKSSVSNFTLTGILAIKGVAKEVQLDVEFAGINKDPWGNEKAGFTLEGKINRKDWGLNWNAALETGGVLVGEEVKISAELQFVKQA
jgi:polyisoprenoid-binding protein YceI